MIDVKKQINTFPYAWYDFCSTGTNHILVIRQGEEYLDIDAFCNQTCEITYSSNIDEVHNSFFECIISLVSPESTDDPHMYIHKCYERLAEQGVLFFSMNNRLGIRYFCGDRDPYTEHVFDGIDSYFKIPEESLSGRCYSRSEIKAILKKAGDFAYKMYGVYSGMDYPTHMIAEDYIPNEDLANRILPVYNYPPTVFLEEERLYDTLKNEKLIHTLANSYLIEVRKKEDDLSDALYITLSISRAKENAYVTIVNGDKTVTKKAIYEEGKAGLYNIKNNSEYLARRKVETVKVSDEIEGSASISMLYYEEPTAQKFLQDLLIKDKNKFLNEMDAFMKEIDKASEVTRVDPLTGPIAGVAFLDMVPLNAFKTERGFTFFDQEFSIQEYPVKAVKTRVLTSFFAFHDELRYVENELFDRYGLSEQKQLFMEMEWSFLKNLLSEADFKPFRDRIRRNTPISDRNREYINRPAGYYETSNIDILRGAEDKDCYVFGAGKYAESFIDRFGKYIRILKILDNNPGRWGEKLKQIEIVSPDVLQKVDKNTIRIFVCVKNNREIIHQLDEMRILDYSIYDKNRVYPRNTGIMSDSNKKYHIGYCAGAFDMFHVGHLNLLRRAKQMCDYLIVGVMSDERMYDLKKKYPIVPCDDRIKIVEGCRYVDRAEELPADRAGILDAYHMFHFDCMFSGDDHANDEEWLVEKDRLQRLGADLVFVSYTKEISSSVLREKAKGRL